MDNNEKVHTVNVKRTFFNQNIEILICRVGGIWWLLFKSICNNRWVYSWLNHHHSFHGDHHHSFTKVAGSTATDSGKCHDQLEREVLATELVVPSRGWGPPMSLNQLGSSSWRSSTWSATTVALSEWYEPMVLGTWWLNAWKRPLLTTPTQSLGSRWVSMATARINQSYFSYHGWPVSIPGFFYRWSTPAPALGVVESKRFPSKFASSGLQIQVLRIKNGG